MTDPRLTPLIPVLSRTARHMADTPAEADDLLQDTLLHLCARLSRGAAIDDLRPYALATLRNLHRSGLRRARPSEELTETAATTPPDALHRLTCAEINRAIARLPPDLARLMQLVAQGETSPAALSGILGIPQGTVMSRLARARARLRSDMGLAPQVPAASLLLDDPAA